MDLLLNYGYSHFLNRDYKCINPLLQVFFKTECMRAVVMYKS